MFESRKNVTEGFFKFQVRAGPRSAGPVRERNFGCLEPRTSIAPCPTTVRLSQTLIPTVSCQMKFQLSSATGCAGSYRKETMGSLSYDPR